MSVWATPGRPARRLIIALSAALVVSLVVAVVVGAVVADRMGLSTPLTVGAHRRLSLTTGSLAGKRNDIAQNYLAPAAARYGLDIQIVESIGSEDALDKVHAGTIDLAFVGGGLSSAGRENVREIIPLYVEPLHLLVRSELAALGGPDPDLSTLLRNRTISMDLVGTGTHTLVSPPDGLLGQLGLTQTDFVEQPASLDQLADPAVDCAALPDALFVLGPLPHPGAANVVEHCNYHLLALPFADAMHLTHNHIYAASIPSGLYRLDPPEPAGNLPTIGTQLLLVANKDLPDSVIQKLLTAILETSFSHLYDPPLTSDALNVVPEFPQHSGVAAYLNSKQPVTLEGLSTASKVIALVSSAVPITLIMFRFLVQWRQRHRVLHLRNLIADLAGIEQQARALEREPGPTAPAAPDLLAQVMALRHAALQKSAVGELHGLELLPAFLAYVGDVAAYLERLAHPDHTPAHASRADSDGHG